MGCWQRNHSPWHWFILCFFFAAAQGATRIEADAEAGFDWPYYLYVSERARLQADRGETVQLLVIPNNSGQTSSELSFQEEQLLQAMERNYGPLAEALGTIILSPVFPRPSEHPHLYTHALDRDCLTTDLPGLERLDLQLVAMVDDAASRLESRSWKVGRKVALIGFSASGMFANRFTFLHPDRVLAAAIGSPGGWPIAPVSKWHGSRLRYPIGIADVRKLTGRPVDLAELRKVPLLVFMGDADENDSVDYQDGYEEQDRRLIDRLFGTTPVERWDDARSLYAAAGLESEFKLYPGVAHTVSPDMIRDITRFLAKQLPEKGNR